MKKYCIMFQEVILMYEDIRNAVKLLKEYCINHKCERCLLDLVVCHDDYPFPYEYSLSRFDKNVKKLEDEES